jgi:hypothetical protein
MKISDIKAKSSERRRIEQAFIFIQLYFVVKYEAISGFEDRKSTIEKYIQGILKPNNPKELNKINNRISKLNIDSGIMDMLKNNIHGHKFILLMYFLTLEIVENSNTILPEELQSLFNDFLEVENENNTEEAREKLRLSARKQAKKLFIKIKNLGYYVK